MITHVLIVEDDSDVIEEIERVLDGFPATISCSVATSRDEAYEHIGSRYLDLVILDLAIPTVSGGMDIDAEHGHAVFNQIRSKAPGTPIFVLTGSSAEDFFRELLRHAERIDIWGQGTKVQTIEFLKKYDIDQCPKVLGPIVAAIEGLADVELDRGGCDMSIAEDRLARIFTKKVDGVKCEVSHLGGGLSGSRVIRLRVTNSQGVRVHDAVAKFGALQDVRKEGDNFDRYISRLAPAATPRKLAALEFGACNLAGVFFGLADGFELTAFSVACEQPRLSTAVIRNIGIATDHWVSEVPEKRTTIQNCRRVVLGDDSFQEVKGHFDLNWCDAFEAREIQCRWACMHGDLHGSNVLVDEHGKVILIDYGDVGEGPASLDPVTLELSLLFHPGNANRSNAWPTLEQAREWGNLDVYLAECPYAEFVSETRHWALRVAAGSREVATSAYSYLVRQLKYEDTNKDLALALLEGVRHFYDGST